MIKKIDFIFFFVCLSFFLSKAANSNIICNTFNTHNEATFLPLPKKPTGLGIRFGFGPALSIYSVNTHHAKSPAQKMSALFSLKKEVLCDRNYKFFFLFGVEYFVHGLNFKSYYFKPDSLQLYDKTFPFNYSLVIQELGLPLQVKYSFKRENNTLFSPYLMIGYHLRYLLLANVNVSQNGTSVKKESVDLQFKNPLFYNKLNSFVSLSLGFQKNNINRGVGNFFAEVQYRYGFSPYLFNTNYNASALNINGMHISLQLGLRF